MRNFLLRKVVYFESCKSGKIFHSIEHFLTVLQMHENKRYAKLDFYMRTHISVPFAWLNRTCSVSYIRHISQNVERGIVIKII